MLRALIGAAALAASLVGPAWAASTMLFSLPDGAAPHDAAPGPDGTVWYTAQGASALGIIDPAMGTVDQVRLGDGSAPHGVIAGPDGAAWITDSGLNAILRYDPKRRTVKSWPLPEEHGNVNLNTATFDKAGRLWFTGQEGFYGTLDPATGAFQVFKDPDGRGAYGITTTPDGRVFYASLAGSHIAEIDLATGEKRRIDPPTKDQGARRIWSDSRGQLWVSEWNTGQLSRYTPDTGAWKSWKLPGKRPRAYAVYVDERDMVWVSDFGADAVVVFDPARETFTGYYPLGVHDANVRQILGRKGEVFLPESGNDMLMIVRYEEAAGG
jgi:virginiamycin B lyase